MTKVAKIDKPGALTREQLLQNKLIRTTVELEDGTQIHIRELSGAERNELSSMYIRHRVPDPRAEKGFRQELPPREAAWIVVRGLLNEDGSQMFKPDDGQQLDQVTPAVLKAIADGICELSGLTGDLEEAVGNSSGTPTSARGTD